MVDGFGLKNLVDSRIFTNLVDITGTSFHACTPYFIAPIARKVEINASLALNEPFVQNIAFGIVKKIANFVLWIAFQIIVSYKPENNPAKAVFLV